MQTCRLCFDGKLKIISIAAKNTLRLLDDVLRRSNGNTHVLFYNKKVLCDQNQTVILVGLSYLLYTSEMSILSNKQSNKIVSKTVNGQYSLYHASLSNTYTRCDNTFSVWTWNIFNITHFTLHRVHTAGQLYTRTPTKTTQGAGCASIDLWFV